MLGGEIREWRGGDGRRRRLEWYFCEGLMSFLRFLLLLSLVVWVGGIAFFAFILAPTVFHPGILPSRQLAGAVVSRSLGILHWMGLSCGAVFLVTSMLEARTVTGVASVFAARNLLIFVMIALTLISMFAISTRMLSLRNDMGFIDDVPHDDARRVEFNRLHVWSTRLESTVLLLGLAVIFLTARRLS
jgi:uncharacterized membrane protein